LELNWSLVLNILLLSLFGWGITWFFASDQFYVDRIEVRGNSGVSSEVIAEASDLQGYSIFWVNPQRVAAEILAAVPPLKQVEVRYGLPRVVAITVQEESDHIAWQVGGQRYWVDEGGILHPAQGSQEPSLLVMDARPGQPTEVDVDALAGARQLIHLMPELRVVQYAPVTGLRFTHPRGWLVYLGTGDMTRKASILRAAEVQFAAEQGSRLSLIDLRFPDSPYYRLSSEGAGGE
jgi:cell division septal protein FtsQ